MTPPPPPPPPSPPVPAPVLPPTAATPTLTPTTSSSETMYHPLNPSPGNFAHSHSHSHSQLPSSLYPTRSPSRLAHPHPQLLHHHPPPPPSSTASSGPGSSAHGNTNANANAPAFHVPVLSQRAPPPPASLLHLTTPPNSSSSASSYSHSHSHPLASTNMSATAATTPYTMPGPPPSPGLGSGDASWLTGGQDLFSGFLADDPPPGESLLTETEQKYFDMFLDWMATGTEPSHDAVEGMAAAANAAVVSASRHPTPDTSLPSPAATTQGSIKSVASGGSGSQSLQQMQYAYGQQQHHHQHQAQSHLSPPSMLSSSFSARRHAPPPIQVQFGAQQQQQQQYQHPSSASRSASFSHHTPLTGPIMSPTSTYLSAASDQPLESPYMPTSPSSPYPTPLTHPHHHHHQQQQQSYPPQPQPQSHNGANPQPIQQLYALTPAGMVPVHVPTAALTAALEAQGMHPPSGSEHPHPQHQPAAAAHHVMYHPHPQHQGQPTLVLASPPPTGTPGSGFVQPGATLLQPSAAHAHAQAHQQQSQQPNGQPMLVQLVPLASPSPSNSGGGMLGLPSPTYQMYTLPSHHQAHQHQHNVSVMGTAPASAADAYATPAPSTPFGHAPHLSGSAGRARTLSTVSAMALDMGHLGLATPTAPTHPQHVFLESPFFLHNQGHAHQQNATVHAPSTTLSVAPPPQQQQQQQQASADVQMDDDAHALDDQVHEFAIPAHAPTLDLPPSPPADPAVHVQPAKPAARKRAAATSKPSATTAAAVGTASRKRARASSSSGDAGGEPADAELKSTAAGSGKVAKRKPAKAKAAKAPVPVDAAAAAAADGVPANSHSEKRRRTLIRLGFQQLVDLVPELRETARVMAKPEAATAASVAGGDKVVGGHTVSKATILTKSFEYMRTVQRKIAKYEALVAQLEAYAARVGVAVPPAALAAGEEHEDGMDEDRAPRLAHLVVAVGGSS